MVLSTTLLAQTKPAPKPHSSGKAEEKPTQVNATIEMMKLEYDLAAEEADFINDLRANGNCVNYDDVFKRHHQKLERIFKRNEELRKELEK